MNVSKNKNVQEISYDKLARLWGVGIGSTGWYNNNNIYSDMKYIGQYNSKYWFKKLYWISVELLIWSMNIQ